MLPYFNEKYGNPSSHSHAFGWEAKAAIDLSREKIADLMKEAGCYSTGFSLESANDKILASLIKEFFDS